MDNLKKIEEENEKINLRFKELRKKYKYIAADREVDDYITNLRDMGEYNRWSLKLSQLWLTEFFNKGKLYNL